VRSLDFLYKELDLASGDLQTATNDPSLCRSRSDWLEKGEWLAAAKRAGAEKIFFVENNPVAVFAECSADLQEKVKAFNKAWSLARPRLLFLAAPGEVTVYDLAQKPVDISKKPEWKKLNHLAILRDLTKVSAELQKFHRDNIESGRVFGDARFGDLHNRADKALIRDLKIVRKELIDAGLSGDNVRFAHALIGRSIFIRYLEDRGVLTENYFRKKVAGQKAGWTDLLLKQQFRSGHDLSGKDVFYPRVLMNKDFTYTLFRALSRDFNGDMFPEVDEEQQVVIQKHLTLIQDLLYGDAGIEKKLFFYSYRFDIVPIDLISSIYEEFYHSSVNEDEKKRKARQEGAYYTPPVLAEFVLSRVLTPEVLIKKPRILDPACGSGIFLVEAFRRIVRYNWHKKQQPLTFDELKDILKGQISGIEANEEAAKITAFSLYLSMLHYLEPPAIDQQIKLGNKLPNLVASSSRSANHFHCILPENAFDVKSMEANVLWKERFGSGCADIIVGNPPWGGGRGEKVAPETKARQKVMLKWCAENKKPIGAKEPSQAFLWRTLDLLKEGGMAGMLVSAGVLFKHGSKTQEFKRQWLELVRLNDVFNFTHVRKFFFRGADSPFLFLHFNKEKRGQSPVQYWSAKRVTKTTKVQAVTFSKYDLQIIRDVDLSDSSVWKQFWFGRYADKELLDFFRNCKKLIDYADRKKCGRGFEIVSMRNDASILKPLRSLIIDSFSNYGQLTFTTPPLRVHRFGALDIYSGPRLLIQRGIEEKSFDKGRIIARYETEPFCFTNAINGVKLSSPEEWRYKTILGIFWSSLARYFFFMTASNWGLWHHEIHLEDELLQLPIVLDKSNLMTKKVIAIVDKLRGYQPQKQDILHPAGVPEKEIEGKRRKWEAELDEAVFTLYGLNEEQRGLIRDCCEVTLPFFYKPFDSIGAMAAITDSDLSWIEKYIHVFCRRWNPYLGDDEEMRAEVHIGAHGNMVAVEFFPADKTDPWDLTPKNNSWGHILEEIGNNLPQPMGISRIVLDGLVHVVSKNGIIIIKRNEKRFWTQSLAREDADATLCKRMVDTEKREARHR
jgi:hypothetical protein